MLRGMERTRLVVLALSLMLLSSRGAVAAPAAPRPALAEECDVLPRPTMRVRLVLERGVPDALRDELQTSIAAVWRTEGLLLTWLPAAAAGEGNPTTDIWLRITTRVFGDIARQAEPTLGVVRFIGALPHRDVLVSYTAVREWIRRERDRRYPALFPASVSRLVGLDWGGFEALAREALGYAAAHEVGHFVLGTRQHDASGLMRRDLASAIGTGPPTAFQLADDSRLRLVERVDRAATCPPRRTP